MSSWLELASRVPQGAILDKLITWMVELSANLANLKITPSLVELQTL